MILTIKGKTPSISKKTFVADNSTVVGNVTLGEDCGVWFGAVIRGDSNSIKIGSRSNIQDLCVVHCDSSHDTIIGDDVTVGHNAIIHGCHIGNRVLIGMGAVVMNGVQIGDDCVIGAGALVTENQVIPPKSLVVGFPAKVKRGLLEEEVKNILKASASYVENAHRYLSGN